jgi:hypothetical protein
MRTIEFQKPEKQREIALETIELYAPMAEKIGLQKIKNELQERSFAILKPDEYKEIKYKVDQKKRTFNSLNLIDDIINELSTTLKENSVVATVFGREKTIYSIWNKMQTKNLQFEEITDIFGGLDDIKSRKLRILHKKSFIHDPSRILRGLKFSVRFNFELEDETKRLQEEYLNNINYDMSYHRIRKELTETFNLNSAEAFDKFVENKIYRFDDWRDLTSILAEHGLI